MCNKKICTCQSHGPAHKEHLAPWGRFVESPYKVPFWVQLWWPIIRISSAYFLPTQSLWWGFEPHSIKRWSKCMKSVVTAGVGSNIKMFRSLLWWLSQQWANPGYWNANIWALLAHVWGANINQELEKTFSGIKLSLSSSSTTHLLTFDNFIRWTLTETKETKKDNSRL